MDPTGNPNPPPGGEANGQTPPTREPESRSRTPPDRLRLRLPGETIAPSVARKQLRGWLAALRWPPAQADDILTAASEAVSNAVEHAYAGHPPGPVNLHATVETRPAGQRRITLVVRDEGRWRPAPVEDEYRRRGIPMMRAFMDTVTIEALTDAEGHPQGTRVVMTSPLAPPVE
ncbi:MAG TPA: ATP-binding protein [Pseudonocardia sp.]|jgi:anti-sigma regulatory factor (Ser/Thr protein kinase)